jgi:hypothetical protein
MLKIYLHNTVIPLDMNDTKLYMDSEIINKE